MAKKAKAEEAVEVAPQPTSVKSAPVQKPIQPKKPEWEIKDRTYLLKGNKTPITFTLNSRHTRRYPLLWFDEKTATQKELRYAVNQNSPLKEEQKGESTLGHIVFKDGVLKVSREQQNLQKMLSIYHPKKDILYYEYKPIEVAENQLEYLEYEIDALNLARQIDIDQAEAILRVELGSKVSNMTSKELKRDLMLFAKQQPQLFMELANDDNVQLRNIAVRAVENGVINLSPDQRTFTWGSNGRKLMNVPFDENPYSAFAAFLKTDEGVEIYKSIEKKL
jgi:hypothetical protein